MKKKKSNVKNFLVFTTKRENGTIVDASPLN